MVVLKQERDKWKTSYEEAITEAQMLKTLKVIMSSIWAHVG